MTLIWQCSLCGFRTMSPIVFDAHTRAGHAWWMLEAYGSYGAPHILGTR